ncbi:tetratricopeptide repeat protein [Sphingomonas sp. 10B4]|uniref:SPOR domain-containing protein n=1 Tax=Sphingomonas sp. 10B4 TaxID=3048575 RepID=UPI002AB53F5A|nr:tetratricopeptide repeat protein [Sphingomonas sp. 10B4]MDY7525554.1 tetratricopeptide repeat protein [Sphingomonas sp. 10B4]MEB0282567.1 tetratricopeptide repeat protein [Sphingomonas sp. 10B4]
MKTRSAITFGPLTVGLSLLMLGGTIAATAVSTIAAASARAQSRAEKEARTEAAAAQQALRAGRFAEAIGHAERAVGDQPDAAEYRMILGQSYLKAGRFASARDAFADTLTLAQGNGKAALNLALAQIATGDWAGARTTLDANAATIPVSDRGLAIALAGDPATAVEMLGAAARGPEADAKVRQNYALSLALAGRWREAQAVVAMDVAPADVSRRILDWSTFSRPSSASDQVATLLGVTPAVDPGLPVALALNGAARGGTTALAKAEQPIDSYMPGQVGAEPAAPSAPVAVAEVAAAPTQQVAAVGPTIAGVVFAERKEVVQALPVAYAKAPTKRGSVAARIAVANSGAAPRAASAFPEPRAPMRGGFVVQLGAYDTAGVAHDAWTRVTRRYAGFASHTPQGMTVSRGGKQFYRLSVGGFARADAVSMCQQYRSRGGACFVRAGAGDQVAMWAKGRELASR